MAPKETILKKTLMTALEAAEACLDGLPIPVAKGCITGILMIVEQEELRKSNNECFKKLLDKIQSLQDIVIKPLQKIAPEAMPDKLKEDFRKFADQLRKLSESYDRNSSTESSTRKRIKHYCRDFIKAGDDEEKLQHIANGIEEAIQSFQLSSDITTQLATHETKRLLEADSLLRDLPEAHTGGRAETCEEGTRASILLDATDWARNVTPGLKQVLWLHGPAGSGKSTVAHTLVTRFFNEDRLGGRFIFSRAGGVVDAGLLFPTLARQLAQYDCDFKMHLAGSIKTKSKYLGSNTPITEQFEYLMRQPLSKLPSSRQAIIIVLDALDECDRPDDVKQIFSLLVENIDRFPFLRVFVTSRREDYIGRTAHRHCQNIYDIDINRTSATDDIRLYLRKRLFDPFTSDQQDAEGATSWPSQPDVETLVQRSNDLFIYAATAVRFIMEGADGDPQANLKRLLQDEDARTRNIFSSLDLMYSAVIRKVLPDDLYADMVDRFQDLIGTVIFNPRPVSVNKLVKLWGSKYDTRQIRVALQYLHSVIAVPDDDDTNGIHVYHKSFVDFITDPKRCNVKSALLNERSMYPELLKRYMSALPETRGWPSQIDCEWNFTNTEPQKFRTFLLELECYLDLPDQEYSDSMRRDFFLGGIKDQLCSPLPPPALAISPRFNRSCPSEVSRRINFVPLSRHSTNLQHYDLRECDPPLCVGGMATKESHIERTMRFDSLVVDPVHANIFVDGDGQFFVKDVGGTFLNGVLLSQPKRESAPHVLQHGDTLQFGFDTTYADTDEFKSVKIRVELQDNPETVNSISANPPSVSLPPPAVDNTQSKSGVTPIALPLPHSEGFKDQLGRQNDYPNYYHYTPFAWIFICTLTFFMLGSA